MDLESDTAWFKSQPCFLLIVEPRARHFTLQCGAILRNDLLHRDAVGRGTGGHETGDHPGNH